MRYMGGKFLLRKHIANFLESIRGEDQIYLEPFAGAASVLQEMSNPRLAGDANSSMVALLNAVQNGWIPPDSLSREEHASYRGPPNGDPMQAFALVGCSFGGDWSKGFASDSIGRNYAEQSKNSLLKQKPLLEGVVFEHKYFHEWEPDDYLIYCDPPYSNTVKYTAIGDFDNEFFWDVAREWTFKNTVVVSEYTAPDDFVCVKEFPKTQGLRSKEGAKRIHERLFMHESQACLLTR